MAVYRWRLRALKAGFVCALLAPGAAPALDYRFVPLAQPGCSDDCPQVVVATGTISGRESELFSWFMRHSGRNRRIAQLLVIHSPGGNAYGGMALGTMLRKAGMTVVVARASGGAIASDRGLGQGLCGSACVFVLAGGAKRVVPTGSMVAIHRARQNRTDMHDSVSGRVQTRAIGSEEVARIFGDYYASMGVSRELARLGESTPNSGMRILTAAEMARFRLARPRLQ